MQKNGNAKAEEVKTVKAAEVKPEEKKAVEAVAAEAPAPKKRGPKPGSKRTDKAASKKNEKPAPTKDMFVQIWDKEIDINKVEENIKAQFVADGHRAGAIKKMCVYVKPEEGYAYYVINDKFEGSVYLY